MLVVLRIGHRIARDKRISTHAGLVARAYGADKIVYSGQRDEDLLRSVRRVVESWGGPFEVGYEKNWKKFVKGWKKKGLVVHLTMYGRNLPDVIDKIKGSVLVVIGGEKVPREIYGLADINVAISNQPHSEIAALATFLDRLFKGKELKKEFKDARLRIVPKEKGKGYAKVL